MKTEEFKEGRVKKTLVNHYPDGTSDTEIVLENNEKIIYSQAAPIPQGHRISAEGTFMSLISALAELHPKYFDSRDPSYRVRMSRTFSQDFLKLVTDQATERVLRSKKIHDFDYDITYEEV